MGKFIINGGSKLKGEVTIEGAKNAVLPILAATVLNEGFSIIKNCPRLKDVEITLEILRKIGCKVSMEDNTVIVDSSFINTTEIPGDLSTEMRASIIFLGPILSKFGKVTITHPGGCEIGHRPIDLHLKALKRMGARISEVPGGLLICEADRLKGCDINLDYPSVGATENVMLAAAMADGDTLIRNAAKEPEIIDLQNLLIGMGLAVSGAGTSVIRVSPVSRLKSVVHNVIPDRIVAGTYMVASAITGGTVLLKNIIPEHLSSVVSNLRDSGCHVNIKRNTMTVSGPAKPRAVDIIRTLPYPGFPTDMQAQMVALFTVARGTSMVVETVFENRYKHVDELIKMGANIKVENRIAIIKGVKKLFGAPVHARDLRGGAALIAAGLAAEGETIVLGSKHIERGYEDIELKLQGLGASIRKED